MFIYSSIMDTSKYIIFIWLIFLSSNKLKVTSWASDSLISELNKTLLIIEPEEYGEAFNCRSEQLAPYFKLICGKPVIIKRHLLYSINVLSGSIKTVKKPWFCDAAMCNWSTTCKSGSFGDKLTQQNNLFLHHRSQLSNISDQLF